MTGRFALVLWAGLVSLACWPVHAEERCASFPSPRTTAVISDLHLGEGAVGTDWSPYEDFRWPRALAGFLDFIHAAGGGRADLVIAGDLFEMWQHPLVVCRGGGKNHGCTVPEMEKITENLARAHAADLETLGRFASRGENRLIVVPGNHDAALMIDSVWQKVLPGFKSARGRVCRAASGTWVSGDGYIFVEHGHQIGIDVNRFPQWPRVTSRHWWQERMVKTWGESFVQRLYNTVEDDYPLIDNLQPMGSGIINYLKNEGMLTAVPRDLARFITFNVFETSLRQKLTLAPQARSSGPAWDVDFARGRGHRLLADAMDDGDPLRTSLLTDQTPAWDGVREELDALTRSPSSLPREEVLALCDQIAILAEGAPAGRTSCQSELGGALLQNLVPEQRRMASYLNRLKDAHRDLEIFIYGHTHRLNACWKVPVRDGSLISVLNTGAFHRLVDEDRLESLAPEAVMTPEKALADLPLDRLPACYSVVFVRYEEGVPRAELKQWLMTEDGPPGELVPACDARCAEINADLCGGASSTGEPCVD